jgi:hypothetical protein
MISIRRPACGRPYDAHPDHRYPLYLGEINYQGVCYGWTPTQASACQLIRDVQAAIDLYEVGNARSSGTLGLELHIGPHVRPALYEVMTEGSPDAEALISNRLMGVSLVPAAKQRPGGWALYASGQRLEVGEVQL